MTVRLKGKQLGYPFSIDDSLATVLQNFEVHGNTTVSGVLNVVAESGNISLTHTDIGPGSIHGLVISDDASSIGLPAPLPITLLTSTDNGVFTLGKLVGNEEAIIQILPAGIAYDSTSLSIRVDDDEMAGTFYSEVLLKEDTVSLLKSIQGNSSIRNSVLLTENSLQLTTHDGSISLDSAGSITINSTDSFSLTSPNFSFGENGFSVVTTSGMSFFGGNGEIVFDTDSIVTFISNSNIVQLKNTSLEITSDLNLYGDLTVANTVSISGNVSFDGGDVNYHYGIPYFTEFDNGNSGSTKTIDWGNGTKQKLTMTATCSGTFSSPPGPCNLTLSIIQGGSGSYTMTWPNTVKWPGGVAPTLSTAVASIDIVAFYYNGTNYYGTASIGFA